MDVAAAEFEEAAEERFDHHTVAFGGSPGEL
jgi:hypothetical protein